MSKQKSNISGKNSCVKQFLKIVFLPDDILVLQNDVYIICLLKHKLHFIAWFFIKSPNLTMSSHLPSLVHYVINFLFIPDLTGSHLLQISCLYLNNEEFRNTRTT